MGSIDLTTRPKVQIPAKVITKVTRHKKENEDEIFQLHYFMHKPIGFLKAPEVETADVYIENGEGERKNADGAIEKYTLLRFVGGDYTKIMNLPDPDAPLVVEPVIVDDVVVGESPKKGWGRLQK